MLLLKTLTAATALALLAAQSPAENWPTWRGPHGDGKSAETNLPLTWSAKENVKWNVPLPERGNSTPIAWGDRVFVTQAVGPRRTVTCLDRADGKQLWQEGPSWTKPERTHGTNPPCSSSPVTDGERVIAWFGSAGLWCWDLTGKELWHADLGLQDHEWGYGSSPILQGGLCILNFGPGPRSFIVALDKVTGKEIWRTDVPSPPVKEGPGAEQNYVGSWSTPVVVDLGHGTELILPLPGAVYGFDPDTGKEKWHCNGLNPVCYADALYVDETVVAMAGYGGYAIGVKAGGAGDVTDTHRLWQEKRNSQRIGSGVATGGLVYMVNEAGVVQCLEPKTGKIVWQKRMEAPGGRASSWSSMVLSGDRIYLLTQASDTVVLRAGPMFEQLAVNSLEDGLCNSSLAISNGDFFIRTHKSLWCIRAAGK